MDYREIENAVEQYLAARGIEFGAGYVGQMKDDSGWEHFLWRVHLSRSPTKRFSTDYRMGLAHVIKSKKSYMQDKPKAPTATQVLHSLIHDTRSGGMSFRDFCDDLGYNYDSIKDLNMYRECEEIAHKMRKIFTREEFEKFEEMLQDY